MLAMAAAMLHAHDSINWYNKHEFDYSVQPAKMGHDSHQRVLSDVTSNNYFTVGKTRTRVTEVVENGKKIQRTEKWTTKDAPMNWTNIGLSTGAAALAVGGAVAFAYGLELDDIKNALAMGIITPAQADDVVAKAKEIVKDEKLEASTVLKVKKDIDNELQVLKKAQFNSFVMKPLLKDKKIWEAMPNDDVNPYFDEDTQGLTKDQLLAIHPIAAAVTVPTAAVFGSLVAPVEGIKGAFEGTVQGARAAYDKGYKQAGIIGGLAASVPGGVTGGASGAIEGSVYGASRGAAWAAQAVNENVTKALGHGPADTSVNYRDELINS